MRFLYSLIVYVLAPGFWIYLAVRGLRDPRWWRGWNQRLGLVERAAHTGAIHVHASSVGEVNAAAPLVRALGGRPESPGVIVTTVTATGLQRARELFGEKVPCAYLPLDLPGAVARFLDRRRPALMIVLETEIWPNLLTAARRRDIPALLVNARLSERSLKGYSRWPSLMRESLGSFAAVLAQTGRDAERFVAAGADPNRVQVSGNLKFDASVPRGVEEAGRELRAAWGSGRPVLTAGSTHEDDERALLAALHRVLERHADALLVLAPRHPERFSRVAADVAGTGLGLHRLSEGEPAGVAAPVLLLDAMGRLMPFYAAADLAFVGGTIAPVGGHNILEPAALGKPVLVGPHVENAADVCEAMLEAGGAVCVSDASELADEWLRLVSDADARARMGRAARKRVEDGQGALRACLAAIDALGVGGAGNAGRTGSPMMDAPDSGPTSGSG